MDAKELKLQLKQAREAINQKDYKSALKHCKVILKHDKENYNAWVFVGLSAQETDESHEAEEAFKTAINIAPKQLLAWQGLCSFYEKTKDDENAFNTMFKLVQMFDNDKTKQLEMIPKLKDLSNRMKHKDSIIKVLELQLDLEEENQADLWQEIFYELCVERDVKHQKLLATALKHIIEHPSFDEEAAKKIIVSCIAPLYKDGFPDQSMDLVNILMDNKMSSNLCVQFLLESSLKDEIDKRKCAIDLEVVLAMADKCGMKDSTYHHLCCSLSFFRQNNYSSALTEAKLGLLERPDCLEGLFLLTKTQLKLHLNKDAEENATSGLQVATICEASSEIIGYFYLYLGDALTGSQKWESAFKSYEKSVEYLGRTIDVIKSFCLALLEVGHVKEAQKMYAEFHSLSEDPAQLLLFEGYIHMLNKNYAAAMNKLRSQISHGESPFTLHLIGRILWETEEFEKASKIFSKAVVMDPFFAKNFLYLGHYYLKVLAEKKKAQQCYQKAYDLNPMDEEAGLGLSSVLKSLGENESYGALLKKITQEAPVGSSKWAWTQLGLYQLDTGLATDAIFSLQNAIRSDPINSYCWQCLGDAYLKRGSYESALKSFEKASELNDSHMYPLYQVSTIQKLRGLYDDAIIKYRRLLEVAPTYIPALVGLSETLLLSGQQLFDECLFGRARDRFQEALNVLASIVQSGSSLCCLWKLAADACTSASRLGEKWLPLLIPSEFNIENPSASSKSDLLRIGAKFYGCALALNENLSTLWHDLGVNCYLQSAVSEMKLDFIKKAFICLQKAVSLAPNNHDHWSTLGIIASSKELKDYALAQHAFLKSIQLESNNVEAWSNLGTLYLENGNIDLAHRAFKVAQSVDPSFQLSWIGQAMIADTVSHNETMDLYRHAAALGSHVEAYLGYGRSVCRTLLETSNHSTESYKYNIEQMDAVVVASDCLNRCIANNEMPPEVFNHLGILLERQKLYGEAHSAYEGARDLCEEDEVEDCIVNYGRILSSLGQYSESIEQFLVLRKVDVSLLCSFGHVLYRDKKFPKAHQVFKRALETCKDEATKSHILVAMSMALFKSPSPERNEARKVLLESCQIEPPSVNGLLALWSLSTLSKNTSSSISIIKKLIAPFEHHNDYSSSISLLDATQTYIQDGFKASRAKLLSAIHKEPNNATNWMQAALSMLHWNPESADQVSRCSQISMFHNGNKELASQIFALSKLTAGYKSVSLVAAQKAVHIQPDHLSNWIALTAACHVANKDRRHVGWIFNFVKTLGRKQGIKTDVLGWLICMEVVHDILSQNFSSAAKLIKQAITVEAFDSKTVSTLHILNGLIEMHETKKIDALVLAVTSNPSNLLGWQILIRYLTHKEKYVEAERTIQQFLLASSKHFPKMRLYPLLHLAILSHKAIYVLDDADKWMKTRDEAISEAVRTFPDSQAVRFLQGIFAIDTNNTNLARRSFEKVLFNSSIKEPKWMESTALNLIVPIYEAKKDVEALKRLSERFPLDEKVKLTLVELN